MALRRGEATVHREKDEAQAIAKAFTGALENFREQHGREPTFDYTSFQGGFTTLDVVFELTEEEWD